MKLEDKIEIYRKLANQLSQLKTEEKLARIDLCESLKIDKLPIGTNNLEKKGYDIKLVKKLNYKLDEDLLSSIYDDFDDEEMECIRFKPSLVMKNYGYLKDKTKVDLVITTTPALPTLTITLKET